MAGSGTEVSPVAVLAAASLEPQVVILDLAGKELEASREAVDSEAVAFLEMKGSPAAGSAVWEASQVEGWEMVSSEKGLLQEVAALVESEKPVTLALQAPVVSLVQALALVLHLADTFPR